MTVRLCKRGHERTPENTGPKGQCKQCARERAYAYYYKFVAPANPQPKKKDVCKNGHARTPDNVNSSGGCKICAREKARLKYGTEEYNRKKLAWQKNNPDKMKVIRRKTKKKNGEKYRIKEREWFERNKERVYATNKASYERNKDKRVAYSKRYLAENRHLVLANIAKRKAAKSQRTPKWLSKDQLATIRLFYFLAKEMEKQTGVPHHVDHIVPLRGKLVSGLHVPWNLQVIPAELNMRKHNCFTPGAQC